MDTDRARFRTTLFMDPGSSFRDDESADFRRAGQDAKYLAYVSFANTAGADMKRPWISFDSLAAMVAHPLWAD